MRERRSFAAPLVPAFPVGCLVLALAAACDNATTGPTALAMAGPWVSYCLDDAVAAYRLDQPAYSYYVWNLPGTATAGRYPYRLALAADGRMSGGGRYESMTTVVTDWVGTGPDTTVDNTTWLLPASGMGRWRVEAGALRLTFDDPTLVLGGQRLTAPLFTTGSPAHLSAPDSTGFVFTFLYQFTDVDGSTTSESVQWSWVVCP